MEQLKCVSCDSPLTQGDRFCDTCGAAAGNGQHPPRWPDAPAVADGAVNGGQQTVAVRTDPAQPFFGHGGIPQASHMTNATRYLCAAAYLDGSFADDVVWEIVASHRAIAPSIDIDIGPVIRHCLNSRRLRLIRDVVLVALALVLFIIEPLPTLDFLLICLVVGVLLPRVLARRRILLIRALITVGFATMVILLSGWFIAQMVGSFQALSLQSHSLSAGLGGGISVGGVLFILLLVAWAAQSVFLSSWLRALAQDLQRGASPPAGYEGAAKNRIAVAEASQWGNIVLHGSEDPFIGTGYSVGEWSIAIELDRAQSAKTSAADGKPRVYAPIDPVELQERIRVRLLKLNDPSLPPNERLFGLSVADAVVGSGQLRWDSPLIDGANSAPYSMASPEAIDAMIRHPQGALRHYLRVSVCDQGPPIMSDGRQILAGVDQGIAVSAFVYVAVEGRMFYLQFIRKALPPVRGAFQLVDRMPLATSGRFRAAIAWQGLTSMFGAVMNAPGGLYRSIRLSLRERRFEREFSLGERLYVDFGTRFSVREYGMAAAFGSYIRELDVDKYTRIIERLLLDTVLDFLKEKNVDISAFAASADTIINNTVNASNISAQTLQVGGTNTVHQGQPQRQQGK